MCGRISWNFDQLFGRQRVNTRLSTFRKPPRRLRNPTSGLKLRPVFCVRKAQRQRLRVVTRLNLKGVLVLADRRASPFVQRSLRPDPSCRCPTGRSAANARLWLLGPASSPVACLRRTSPPRSERPLKSRRTRATVKLFPNPTSASSVCMFSNPMLTAPARPEVARPR